MFEDNGDRRHPATPTRLQNAREQGDVSRSMQLAGAIQLLGFLAVATCLLPPLMDSLKNVAASTWSSGSIDASQFAPASSISQAVWGIMPAFVGLLAILMLISIVSYFLQTGFLFQPSRVSLDVSRISPSHWWERVLSPASYVTALLDLPKVLLVLAAAGAVVYVNLESVVAIGNQSVNSMLKDIAGLILKIGFQTALILFLFGLADYGLAWFGRMRRLRMSDNELREEIRMQQGDPQTTERRRRIRREMTG